MRVFNSVECKSLKGGRREERECVPEGTAHKPTQTKLWGWEKVVGGR
jgi:hypothetical protein